MNHEEFDNIVEEVDLSEVPNIALIGVEDEDVPNIIRIPVVERRMSRKTSLDEITSNGSIAAGAMVLGAVLAVIVANTGAYEMIQQAIAAPLGITIGPFSTSISFEAFVNDLLMALFFVLVGIELKYEMTVGQLAQPRQAALPMLAAVGGVVVPAAIYLGLNPGPTHTGWAVPIATDIAFALGVMSLLGKRVSGATKVFFSTLAIADDILAIIVIALFYGHTPHPLWLGASVVMTIILWLLNRAKIYTVRYYAFFGALLWVCMYQSGIHATLAGVIFAFALPSRSDIRLDSLGEWLNWAGTLLSYNYDDDSHVLGQHDFTDAATDVERVMHRVTPPLQRVEAKFSVFVNFVVLPLFAFVNAQVRLVGVDVAQIAASSVARGALIGAVVGKPVGIVLVTLILVKIGFAKLPRGVSWSQIVGVGLMGGLGFTMSILIAGLAFTNPADVLAAKCAILVGSVLASVVGCVFIFLTTRDESAHHGRFGIHMHGNHPGQTSA